MLCIFLICLVFVKFKTNYKIKKCPLFKEKQTIFVLRYRVNSSITKCGFNCLLLFYLPTNTSYTLNNIYTIFFVSVTFMCKLDHVGTSMHYYSSSNRRVFKLNFHTGGWSSNPTFNLHTICSASSITSTAPSWQRERRKMRPFSYADQAQGI